MPRTIVRPSRDLRNNYAEICKSLKQHDHVIITNNGVGESVLINIDDFADYEEYLHHRYIYEILQESKAEASNPNDVQIDSSVVFADIKKKITERGT